MGDFIMSGLKKNLHSMRTKILGIFAIVLLVIVGMLVTSMGIDFKNSVNTAVKNNMFDLCKFEGESMDRTLENTKAEDLKVDQLQIMFQDGKVTGIDSSYTYYVGSDGTMLYHPTADKIGSSVENSVVLDLISRLKAGEKIQPEVVEYEFKGTVKLAGYYVCSDNSIVVLGADKSEVIAAGNKAMQKAIFLGLICFILAMVLGSVVLMKILKPMRVCADSIRSLSELDIRSSEELKQAARRKDEFGIISAAILHLTENLSEVLKEVGIASKSLNEKSVSLLELAGEVKEHSENNAATSEELAASMEETSVAVEDVNDNVTSINTNVESITTNIQQANDMAKEIIVRAKKLKVQTADAKDQTQKMSQNIQKESDMALEKSKSVEKIESLTEAIRSIAEQTSLLSLNASIEAARAGESGKGFAVVASEISTLAGQTTQTVEDISGIVVEVQDAVKEMTSCLDQTIRFLVENVSKDYENFIDVSSQYDKDAKYFSDVTEHVSDSIQQLSTATSQIVKAMQEINISVGEATNGITDIAERTTDIAGISLTNQEEIHRNKEMAGTLQACVDKFITE